MASSTLTGPLCATAATSAIGLSVAVSKLLIHYPVLSAQAVRHASGATALLAVARLCRQRLPRPTGRDLALLLALGAVGLVGFNILLLAALQRAEPAAVGVVVGCVPVLLALAGPLLAHRAPSAQVVAAAMLRRSARAWCTAPARPPRLGWPRCRLGPSPRRRTAPATRSGTRRARSRGGHGSARS
jgi:drug/metabolite transporter (DMT)-like permease